MRALNAPLLLADDLELAPFKNALQRNITILMRNPERAMVFGPMVISAKEYAQSLQKLLLINEKNEFLRRIERDFQLFEVYGRDRFGEIMLTSYYEPLYPGSVRPTKELHQPIYGMPHDLVEVDIESMGGTGLGEFETDRRKMGGRIIHDGRPIARIVPYYSREEIDIHQKFKGKKS